MLNGFLLLRTVLGSDCLSYTPGDQENLDQITIRAIDDELASLTPDEQFVIRCRFSFTKLTLKETGRKLRGVTREVIRQKESKAIRKLRHPTRLRPILKALAVLNGQYNPVSC